MTLRTLSNIKEKILVVGAIYDKIDKIDRIKDRLSDYFVTIFNGNLLFPYNSIDEIKSRIKIMDDLLQTGKVIYNLGGYDLKLLTVFHQNDEHFDIQKWIASKPNVIAIDFINSSSVLVMSGGVTPSMNSRKQLNDQNEVSFVSYFRDDPWQIYYGGGMGYIISNSPMGDKPRFFPYSARIGTKYTKECDIYAQEVGPSGLKNIIKL